MKTLLVVALALLWARDVSAQEFAVVNRCPQFTVTNKTAPPAALRTASGALIRPNGSGGYEYATESQAAPVSALPQSIGSPCPSGTCPAPTSGFPFRRR